MTAQVPLPDDLMIWAHACPACLAPVLVGERNSRGWWVCRNCGTRQRTPMLRCGCQLHRAAHLDSGEEPDFVVLDATGQEIGRASVLDDAVEQAMWAMRDAGVKPE